MERVGWLRYFPGLDAAAPPVPVRHALRLAWLGGALLAVAAEAQAPETWARLSAADGLAHNSVYAIHQDRAGFLWFGTVDGLDRYDGYAFVHHRHDPDDPASLPHNLVRSIHEDADGALWVGTQGGVARLGPHGGEFQRFAVPPGPTGDRSVYDLARDRRGTLWAASAAGLLRLDARRGRFVAATAQRGVATALALRADTLWVLHDGEEPGAATLVRADVRRRRILGRWHVDAAVGAGHVLELDADGGVWLSGAGPLVLGAGEAWVEGTAPRGVRALAVLPDGGALVGLDGDGLARCADGACRTTLVDRDRPDWLHNYVRALHRDRSGAVWVGTYGGVYRSDPARKPFGTLRHRPNDSASLGSPAVSALAETPDGALWAASFDGALDRLDLATGRAERFGMGGTRPAGIGGVWTLFVDGRGRLWAGGTDGLAAVDWRTGRATRHPAVGAALGGSALTSIAEDSAGRLWVGSFGGLVRYDPARGETVLFPVTGDGRGPSQVVVNTIRRDGDVLWLGSPSGGLDRLDPATGRFEALGWRNAAGERPSGEATYDVLPDGRGGVWVGTVEGLIHRRADGTGRHLTTADGLPGTVVYSVQPDGRGRLWLGTNRGLARLDPATGSVTTYDLADGIGTMEFNRSARLQTRDGRLVFGGATGVVGFDPEAIRPDRRRPEVALVGVEAASRSGVRRLDGRGLEGVVLSPSERTATFTLAALAFEDPSQSRYAYRLDGLDEEWVQAGTERRARYTGLPPGDYVFRARAANHDGTWSEGALVMPVRVEPWMWETTWFRVLAVALLLGLAALAYRARVARLLAVERLRLRIAGDLHDDLSSDLSGIALATDLLGRRPGLDTADRQRLADVHSTATSMVDALRDIVWTVDPAHDSVEAFARRVRLVADRLLDGRPHAVEVDLPDAGALPMPLRRELLLILKEALHNAQRHAEAGRVDVRLGRDGADLVLVVEDDGVGFDPAAVASGHGLRSLRTRAERVGGALAVDSAPGRGTRVRLAVPLPRNREARARRWAVPWLRRHATP